MTLFHCSQNIKKKHCCTLPPAFHFPNTFFCRRGLRLIAPSQSNFSTVENIDFPEKKKSPFLNIHLRKLFFSFHDCPELMVSHFLFLLFLFSFCIHVLSQTAIGFLVVLYLWESERPPAEIRKKKEKSFKKAPIFSAFFFEGKISKPWRFHFSEKKKTIFFFFFFFLQA